MSRNLADQLHTAEADFAHCFRHCRRTLRSAATTAVAGSSRRAELLKNARTSSLGQPCDGTNLRFLPSGYATVGRGRVLRRGFLSVCKDTSYNSYGPTSMIALRESASLSLSGRLTGLGAGFSISGAARLGPFVPGPLSLRPRSRHPRLLSTISYPTSLFHLCSREARMNSVTISLLLATQIGPAILDPGMFLGYIAPTAC